jgi:hypothetical protein
MNDAINIVHLPKIHQHYFSKSAQIKTKFSADFTVPSLQIAANNEGAYLFDQIYHGTCQEDGRVLHGSRSPGACDAVFYLRILPSSRRHSSYVVPLFCSAVFFLRTRRRSARHCIKIKGKRSETEYNAEARRGEKTPPHHLKAPRRAPVRLYSISLRDPRLQAIHASHSSKTKRSETCAGVYF